MERLWDAGEPAVRVDPAATMPPHLLARVLTNLDGASLASAAAVSKQWSAVAANAQQQQQQPAARVSPDELASLHALGALLFTLRVCVLSVDQWGVVAQYCRTYHEAGLARVLRAHRFAVFVLLLGVPLALARLSGWLLLLMVLQAALLVSARAVLAAHALHALLVVALLRADVHAWTALAAAHPLWALPAVTLEAFAVLVGSMFVFRAPGALGAPAPSALFFDTTTLALCALRYAGWVVTAATHASPVAAVMTLAPLSAVVVRASGKRVASTLTRVARVLPASVVAWFTCAVVTGHLAAARWTMPLVLVVACVACLSSISGRWFGDGDRLVNARAFQRLLRVSLLVVAVAWLAK